MTKLASVAAMLLLVHGRMANAQTCTYAPYTNDTDTVTAVNFDGSTGDVVYQTGAIGYISGPNGVQQAATFGADAWAEYAIPAWPSWSSPWTVPPAGTFEEWVQIQSYGASSLVLNWSSQTSAPSEGYVLELGTNSSGNSSVGGWNGIPSTFNALTGTSAIPLNTWTQLAYTWGPGGSQLYVNGVAQATNSAASGPAMGHNQPTTYLYVNGWGGVQLAIAGFRVSNVARTNFCAAPAQLPTIVSGPNLPTAEIGAAYNQTLSATGGTPPYISWNMTSGALPAGLSLDSGAGTITGTPTTGSGGDYQIVVTVTDSAGATSQPATLSLTVVGPPSIILNGPLPMGVVGANYVALLDFVGGVSPYTYQLAQGSALPPGLSLAPPQGCVTYCPGEISGTPSSAGTFNFSVVVTDGAGGSSGPVPLSITIVTPLLITTPALPNGVISSAYSTQLMAQGGVLPYTWSGCPQPQLPPGLSLNISTGLISGTPTSTGSFSFCLGVADSTSPTPQFKSAPYTVSIASSLTLEFQTLPAGVVAFSYPGATLQAVGGTPPYSSWSIASGALPPGLSLNNSSGAIAGTPTSAGTYSFTVRVADSGTPSQTGTQQYSITISQSLTILTLSVPNGVVNSQYVSTTLLAQGGTSPYTWSISNGTLPPGISLGSSTGTLSGTPTVAGPFNFTVKVTDSTSPVSLTATQSYSGTIAPTLALSCSPLTASGPAGEPISISCTDSGGTPPYYWTYSTLPSWVSWSGAYNGMNFSGTPPAAGTWSISVNVTDRTLPTNLSVNQTITFNISAGLAINCSPAPVVGQAGVSISILCSAAGGTPPYHWLPAGFPSWLSPSGSAGAGITLSGTPPSAGSFSGSVTVTDSTTPIALTASQSISGSIALALSALPVSLTFTYDQGQSVPGAQTISVFSNGSAVQYSVSASYAKNQPTGWLRLTPASGQTPGNVSVSLQNLSSLPPCPGPTPCNFSGTITAAPPSGSGISSATVTVTLSVAPQQPQLSVSPVSVTASAVTGAAAVQQQIQVSNSGNGSLNYAVATPTTSWLTVTCGSSGTVTSSSSAPVCLSLDPGMLQPGTYHTQLSINAGSQSAAVNVTLQVAPADPLILLSPNAMQFTAVSGGATPSPQSMSIFNIGTGTLDWTGQATSTHSWLQLSTANGCAGAGQIATGSAMSGGPPSSLTVCVDLAQAAVGENFGQIAVSSDSSANSEAITVLLNVLPGGSALPELASPTGVTLQTTAGSSTMPSSVTLSNPNSTPVSFNAIAAALSGGSSWLVVTPAGASVPANGSTTVQVQGAATSLAAGTYDGQVRIGFGDGSSQVVNVIFNVNPQSGQARREQRRSVLPDCPGGYVLPPQFVNLTQSGFQVPAGDVQLLQVTVKDSCGNAITPTDQGSTMSVVIYNTANEGTLETPNLLYNSTDQKWEFSWTPTAVEVGPVGMYAIAGVGTGDNSIGNRSDIWTGSVTAAAPGSGAEPVAVANAASVNLDHIVEVNQVAAGSYISIYWTLLADGQALTYPFPKQEEGSTVELGGVPLLLEYVSPTQVNALVPMQANLPMNAPLPLKIQRDGTWSVNDLQVSVTNIQPAIYVLNASGQGAALIANTTDIAQEGSPAQIGDYIEIYCNGLGPVTNAPADGQPAPGNPLAATTTMPQVTIGGVTVPAYWAGLSPGSVALYQVDLQVPAGAQTGDTVSLTIQMGDVVSNTVYIAVQ